MRFTKDRNRSLDNKRIVAVIPLELSSGLRNLETLFVLACDWSVVKWSVLIGRERLSRD